jgi:hypothetical protein
MSEDRASSTPLALTVGAVLPDLAEELVTVLRSDGYDELADQVFALPFGALCGCGDDLLFNDQAVPRTGLEPV